LATQTTRRSLLAAGAGLILASTGAAETSATDLVVTGNIARFGATRVRCAIGHGGIRADKKEGDGATPAGSWPIRSVLYRADRMRLPNLRLPARAMKPSDGWCDASEDANYNRPVQLPYRASAESLWRNDTIYDVIVVLGYNDNPVVPGKGSAIFLHVARPTYSPTLGCVALARENLLAFLTSASTSSRVIVHA
jgi:L,D-peptidoglycan transpeptidase YkuD (ErfK/YbiS/YcfS/YnhG family)